MQIGLQSFLFFATVFCYFAIVSGLMLLWEMVSSIFGYVITVLKYLGHILGILVLYYCIYSFMFGCPLGIDWKTTVPLIFENKLVVHYMKFIKETIEIIMTNKLAE